MVGSGRQTLGVELGQQCVQIAGLKVPGKRKQSATFESQESLFEVGQRGEFVRHQDRSLDDGAGDLDLIELAGVNRCGEGWR
jgi:hypothetical protein